MGRVGPARVVTGGPGGNADPRQVEAVGQGLAVKAGQADADQAGQTGRCAVEAGLRPACAQCAAEIGRQRALGGGAFGPAGAGQFQRAGKADDLGDRLGARAQPALLAAAEDQRLQRGRLAGIQKTDALGPAEFVGRSGEVVDVGQRKFQVPGGLYGVDMQRHAGRRTLRRKGGDILNDADLVVGVLHADQPRAAGQGGLQRGGHDLPGRIDRHGADRDPLLLQEGAGAADRVPGPGRPAPFRMAQVLPSLPPEVKKIWCGAQPRQAATVRRACSTARRAARPLR